MNSLFPYKGGQRYERQQANSAERQGNGTTSPHHRSSETCDPLISLHGTKTKVSKRKGN